MYDKCKILDTIKILKDKNILIEKFDIGDEIKNLKNLSKEEWLDDTIKLLITLKDKNLIDPLGQRVYLEPGNTEKN